MRIFFNSMILAISMYTSLPVPQLDWGKTSMRHVMTVFPLLGLLVAGAVRLWLLVGYRTGMESVLLTAGLVLIPLVVTGGIHLDGFLDTCDALSSNQDRSRRLEILKDPHVGAFGVMFMGGYYVLIMGLVHQLLSRPAAVGVWLGGFVMSRALAVLAMSWMPYAREDGLARFFGDQSNRQVLRIASVMYVLATLIRMAVLSPAGTLVSALLLIAGGYFFRRMCIRSFGGLTGDLLGFGITVSELLILTGAVTGGLI